MESNNRSLNASEKYKLMKALESMYPVDFLLYPNEQNMKLYWNQCCEWLIYHMTNIPICLGGVTSRQKHDIELECLEAAKRIGVNLMKMPNVKLTEI